ncbi:F-box only protein 22-like [Chelonus insularis]|uniref:F-box only protein 22-like n=1 Tax=Chelonus insularis TaxID=460826 RepID=UPI00158D34D3|nr:F-box only protein 22-like [Chelonus insularis]
MSMEADVISNRRIEPERNDRKKCKLSTYEEKTESSKDESNLLSYDALGIIFSYLPAIDLCHCSQVCKLWRDVATFELSIRKVIIRSGTYEDLIKKHDVNRIFESSIRNKPMLNLVFISKDGVLANLGEDNRAFFGYKKYFPKNCFSVGINVPGLVIENEEYEENKCLSSYFLLPDDPSVHINMINAYLTVSYIFKREKNEYIGSAEYEHEIKSDLSEIFEKGIGGLENPECVILLCIDESYMVRKLNKMNLRGIKSVWGGVVKEIDVIYQHEEVGDDLTWLALIISGKYVKSWSTFLDKNDVNEKDIRSKLLKLKDNLQLYKHTIGLMFSCNGRGAHWYNNRKNVESSIFKSIFPEIPLIGCFGNGEFGNCNVNANPEYNMKRDKIYRQYSTSFMILTYGKIDENLEIDDNN